MRNACVNVGPTQGGYTVVLQQNDYLYSSYLMAKINTWHARYWQAVQAELQDKEYEGEEAKEWSLNIADTIREGVKAVNVPRRESRHLFFLLLLLYS